MIIVIMTMIIGYVTACPSNLIESCYEVRRNEFESKMLDGCLYRVDKEKHTFEVV